MTNRSLTPEQITQLASLTGKPDTDDIPEAPAKNWKGARRGVTVRVLKEAISLRLDGDVLAWFRANHTKYQSEINEVLRLHMQSKMSEASGQKGD